MLTPGTSLGPYRILDKVGEGGMGEVYKAVDTRLDRTVAIKLLTGSAGAPVRERLHLEARALSQLNHPNICTLYDIAETTDADAPASYLVMEFVEGETLAGLIARGPLPLDRALTYGAQIADALDKAHRAGIVHGDLKPANVMITRAGVKLLDFGLAHRRGSVMSADWADAVTRTVSLGTPRELAGTLQYLAPELLEGRASDERADIFSCGAVIYEMVTGRRAFDGETAATVIAAIMRQEVPEVRRVVPGAPAALDRVLARCLAKDPEERWQHAGDLRYELRWLASAGDTPDAPGALREPGAMRRWQAATAALFLVAAGLAIWMLVARPEQDESVLRTSVMLPDGLRFPQAGTIGGGGRVALSPDGRVLATVMSDASGTQMLWLRLLEGQAATPLVGTEGAASPFWSPDSRAIAFVAQGQLKRIDVAGGEPVVIAAPAINATGAWGPDGDILFTPTPGSPLSVVGAAGGEPRAVTTLDAAEGDQVHRNPSFLPDGRRFLYVSVGRNGGSAARRTVLVGSLDGQDEAVRVIDNVAGAKVSGGALLFLRETTLMAQAFDAERLALLGEPRPVAEQVEGGGIVAASFSVSDTGLLAYQPSSQAGSQLLWYDRQGRQLGTVADPADYADVELSPDGRLAAVSVLDPATNTRDLWIVDVARGVRTRFTSDRFDDVAPVWSRDGTRVMFTSNRSGHFDLYEKPASGIGSETLVFADDSEKYPTSWLSDAGLVLYWTFDADGTELHLLTLNGAPRARSFLPSPVSPGRFSPDGRHVLYYSTESGRSEVYLVPFPSATRRWQISTAGGNFARWRADGQEIFYVGRDNRLMATSINAETDRVEIGQPVALFEARPVGPRYPFDVAPDGERFLVNTVRGASAVSSVTIVQNWRRLLTP